jgi:hypothetical protein
MQRYSQILPILLIAIFANLGIFSDRARAKPPTNVAEFWALQPTCPNLDFRGYGNSRKIVEDLANGYLEVGGDSSRMSIAIFKQATGKYIVGVNQSDTVTDRSCFLSYHSGRWQDISRQVVPNYSTQNFYELPRRGTTVAIFPLIKRDGDMMTERGAKQGNLYWHKGKFRLSR